MWNRALAVGVPLWLAYTAYRCPCERIFACKPVEVLSAVVVLNLLALYALKY